ncbi:phosphocholine-specific phospholipase C [Pedobacter faecalis]|uniref:phosphocholine-specific phospholipase C n=1 Tax=Pedobacter faecalis TaxID=3041495 RepID=UPI00254B7518|nr:phospholipase C, phosphocholine-specific [Pedobacter sp. ELA7]
MDNRRDFIKKASLLTGGLGMAGILPPAIQKALAINPAVGSTYLDAEHVVFLMQENRSFDHTFGTLKGVRGFNNPRAIRLSDNYPVWLQSNKKGETYAPFRLNIKDTKATWMSALPHSWNDQVDARNNGMHDGWLDAKRSGNKEYADMPLTMGYYNREDIPFYYALADAFTVCDHNFCSSLTGTSPNRCFFWSGTIREEQNESARPHISNGDIDGAERVSWKTFPERLSEHGVDWKVYQNELSVGVGFDGEEDDWLANFTDNDLEFFKQYHVRRHPEHLVALRKTQSKLELQLRDKPDEKLQKKLSETIDAIAFLEKNPLESLNPAQQDLHRRAFVTNRNDPDYHKLETISYEDKGVTRTAQIPKGDVLHQFRSDVDSGNLPAVSWLVAPCNFSDHPGAPWYGAWYLSEVIDILTKNPEVWKKTIFVLTYDENDGYFDHIPPFVAPNPKDPSSGKVSDSLDIRTEYAAKGQTSRESPVGLGFRVPMVVVSPWSRGGYVNSEIFDHTSSIQFLEKFLRHKTGKAIREDNISSWRRSVCGDLSSVFRPYHGEAVKAPESLERLPFIESIHKAQFARLPDGFKKLSQTEIAEIVGNPSASSLLPRQEPGIKPASAIPYELYAEAALSGDGTAVGITFRAGKDFFGDRASAGAFHVYGAGRHWPFTVAAGETLSYQWPLSTFADGKYDLQLYGVNGFYRKYKGSADDPDLDISLHYEQTGRKRPTGGIVLRMSRKNTSEALSLDISDAMYNIANRKVSMKKGQKELLLSFDLSKAHHWYDINVTVDQHPGFIRHYGGHVELLKDSFTDPYMGKA